MKTGTLTAVSLAVLLILPLLLAMPPVCAQAGSGGGIGGGGRGGLEQPVIHEGRVVDITETEVTIREWAGTYTYRLTQGGRQALEGAGIKPGDTVRFSAWEAAQIAFDFKKQCCDR